MQNIDMRLLMVFEEIYKTGSISQAAGKLDIGQPALSMGLRKLRSHFDDPLFVRSGGGMAPTGLAQELMPGVQQALALLQATLNHRSIFEPATSQRVFHVSMTDVAQIVALPGLLRRVESEAPGVGIEVTVTDASTPAKLDSGEIDVVIGFVQTRQAGFYQQKLMDEKFVCISSRGHRRVGRRLSLEQFTEFPHIVVNTAGTGYGLMERILEEQKIVRKVAVRVPSFSSIMAAIQGSEYLAVVPQRLALFLQDTGIARAHDLPFPAPAYAVMQHWHERHGRDPGNRWLRGVIARILQK